MIGEFEFDGLFFAPAEETMLPFREVTLILFVAFLIVMSIIIMNLMVGLAVDDIKAVQEQAVLKRLAMQVRNLFQNQQWLFLALTDPFSKDLCLKELLQYIDLPFSNSIITG